MPPKKTGNLVCNVCHGVGFQTKDGPIICRACNLFLWRAAVYWRIYVCNKEKNCPVYKKKFKCGYCRYIKLVECWKKAVQDESLPHVSDMASTKYLQVHMKVEKMVKLAEEMTAFSANLVRGKRESAPKKSGAESQAERGTAGVKGEVVGADTPPPGASSQSYLQHLVSTSASFDKDEDEPEVKWENGSEPLTFKYENTRFAIKLAKSQKSFTLERIP